MCFGLPSGLDCSAARFENESRPVTNLAETLSSFSEPTIYAKVVAW